MNVAGRTCAPSDMETAWSGIDWDRCRHHVRRLQARIVKATQGGRWGKVIEQCFKVLARHDAAHWILEADIRGCFDNISHEWLLANVPTDKAVLQKWLKAGFMEGTILNPTDDGTPQGGIISPTLANMALDGLEALLKKAFRGTSRSGVWRNPKVRLVRYADDFIISGDSKELLESEVRPLVESFLRSRGLELSEEKTKITHIDQGFDFLGQNLRKYRGKLLIKPAANNVKACADKIRETINGNKTAKQVSLIRLLNPMIHGWALYHRHVVAKDTFRTIDHHVWSALWRWSKRRHPNKGRDWVRHKYFRIIGNRTWVFAAETGERSADGMPTVATLRSASDVHIQRHLKVRADANPFDPAWQPYFAARHAAKGRIGTRVVPRYAFISSTPPPHHPDSTDASPAPSRGLRKA